MTLIDGVILQEEVVYESILINDDVSGEATLYDSSTMEVIGVPIEAVGRTILQFPFVNIVSFLAVHNFGRFSVVSILDMTGRRIHCQEIHTLNSVQIVSNKPISGVIICV